MALKNYTSNDPRLFERIQKALASKAKQVMFDYSDDGKINGVAFTMEVKGQIIAFKLPARYENVERILYANRRSTWKPLSQAQKDQAYKTAWANIRDWLEAQMALIETEMVKPEEVFLPYATDAGGQTLFERFETGNLQLGAGNQQSESSRVIEL